MNESLVNVQVVSCPKCSKWTARLTDHALECMCARGASDERAALERVAELVAALPEVEPNNVMMVDVKAQAIRVLKEATEKWRRKP